MAHGQWLSAIKINSHIRNCILCVGVREFACQLPVTWCCFQQQVRYVAKSTTLPNTSLCRGCQRNKTRSGSARRVRRYPQVRKPFCASRSLHSWPCWQASLLCTQHPAPPLPALLSFARCSVPAPVRTFVEGAHVLATVRYCTRVSLLLLSLRLATDGTGCALLVEAPYSCLVCVRVRVLLV